MARPEVLLIVLDAGGGHRAAARRSSRRRGSAPREWTFRVVNLQDILAPADYTRRLTGRPMEDTYNAHGAAAMDAFPGAAAPRPSNGGSGSVADGWCSSWPTTSRPRSPAVIVSLIPNFNGVIADGLPPRAAPGTPFLVVLTDFADFPPHFWIERDVDRVVVGTEHAEGQAREAGLPASSVSRVSGMILHPRFHVPDPAARQRTRRELGIGAEDFAVLVLFGGKGSPELHPLCAALLGQSPRWHVMAICGDNPRLQASVGELQQTSGGRLHCFGFTDRVLDLMAAADVLATKPGPGTLAEAFHCRVPVVVPSNVYTIPQERFNASFIEAHDLGVVVRHWREIPAAVSSLAADPVRRARMRRHLEVLPENAAVFEVLDLFEQELAAQGLLRRDTLQHARL